MTLEQRVKQQLQQHVDSAGHVHLHNHTHHTPSGSDEGLLAQAEDSPLETFSRFLALTCLLGM